MPGATSSGADASGNVSGSSGARNRAHNQGNQTRKYTPEQKAAVMRIRACQATAFYEILDVARTCSEAEVKKAYRKQSLLTHPDKNGHESADEAFKMVSRAFGVLGDKEKRDKFDRFGTDPDSRFANAQQQQQQNPFAGFAQRRQQGGGRGGMWENDMSPEEMFARFFGGGGGAFDTGPQFVFNFGGGPGIRVHQFGGARPRVRPRNAEAQQAEASLTSTLLGLLPILLLFIFPLISSIFSGVVSPTRSPSISLERPSPPYTSERTIKPHNVKYYVNPNDVAQWSDSKLAQLDKRAEVAWLNNLRNECEDEVQKQRRMLQEAQGWGFFPSQVDIDAANNMPKPHCERLDRAYTRR